MLTNSRYLLGIMKMISCIVTASDPAAKAPAALAEVPLFVPEIRGMDRRIKYKILIILY